MDRQILERLIGAGVLVVILVIVAPLILDGGRDESDDDAAVVAAAPDEQPRRTHTIRLDKAAEQPPVARRAAAAATETLPPAKPEATEAAPPQPAPKPEPKPEPKPQPRPEPAPKPVRKPAPAEPSAPIPASGWAVQLGSFSSRDNARRLAAEVEGRGFSTYLMPLDRSGKTLYRVRVGPRATRAQAEQLAGALAKAGYKGQVTRQVPDA